MAETTKCVRCGSDEALHHRQAGVLKDETLCTSCQGQVKGHREEDLRNKNMPTMTVTLGDLIMQKTKGTSR